MSRLAPDIPELQHVPEAARSLVYLGALNSAIRSPLTWATGALAFVLGVGIGASLGRSAFGGLGAMVGAALGASASVWCFYKAILPWRARRLLPVVMAQVDNNMLGRVRDADESLRRTLEEYRQREAGEIGHTRESRPPRRLP